MSDIADQAQDVIEQHLTASLANRKHNINPAIPSAKYCDDCVGNPRGSPSQSSWCPLVC